MSLVLIKQKTNGGYVHFNSASRTYFIGEGQVGASVFKKPDAIGFIIYNCGSFVYLWDLIEVTDEGDDVL